MNKLTISKPILPVDLHLFFSFLIKGKKQDIKECNQMDKNKTSNLIIAVIEYVYRYIYVQAMKNGWTNGHLLS